MSDPLHAFETTIPTELQEDLLQRIEECAWGFTTNPEIEITDVEKRNVLNIEYTGVVRLMGQEHRFHIRSGDAAGTEILSWNGDTEIDRDPGPVMTLAPLHRRASEAIYQGRAAERGEVAYGSFVEISVSGMFDRRVFRLGGADSDPRRGELSVSSPIGKALLGLTAGTKTEYRAGPVRRRIDLHAVDNRLVLSRLGAAADPEGAPEPV